MIKEQIISTAFDLFSQYGIKGVSMDDIARKIGISKRTLYGIFDDKETLLVEGMQTTTDRLTIILDQLEKGSYTAVDIIILFYEEVMKRPRWYNHKYYDDLLKYPKALQKKEEEKTKFSQRCTLLFNRGVNEGVFQKEVNFEIVALLVKEQLKMLQPSKSFSKHSNQEVYNTVLITFLRGICTQKGRDILDKWIRTKHIQSIS